MTRKHFEMIAAVIKNLAVDNSIKNILAVEFSKKLVDTNPNFNADKFIKACQS